MINLNGLGIEVWKQIYDENIDRMNSLNHAKDITILGKLLITNIQNFNILNRKINKWSSFKHKYAH